MKLLVILLCILSERFLVHAFSYNRLHGFNTYLHTIIEHSLFKNMSSTPWLALGLLILPLLLSTGIIYFIFHNWQYGLVGFIFNLIIFYACIGPENPFFPLTSENFEPEEEVGNYFYIINRQLFAPIFWFVLTGPIGVLFYRLITLCQNINSVAIEATMLTNLMEWFPVRMTAFLTLLVGNFQHGIKSFKHLFFTDITNNFNFIRICCVEAVLSNDEQILSVPLAENVVENSLVLLLVIIALCTNIAWL